MPDYIIANLKAHTFFHGTTLEEAELIALNGFQVWTSFSHDFGNGDETHWVPSSGNLGNGIYLSCNWRIALWFGSTLLRATLKPGTRILDVTILPDSKVLQYLRCEFGRAILTESPFRTLPQNKRLTLKELITLFRYHYQKTWEKDYGFNEWGSRWPQTREQHLKLLKVFRSLLIRYGYHGYGNPEDENGIVIFAHDRVELVEVIADIPETRLVNYLVGKSRQFISLDEIRKHFQAHGSKRAKELAKTTATAP